MTFGLVVLAVALALVGAKPRSVEELRTNSRRQASNSSCGDSNFPGFSGFIKTPNYPNNYPNNINCTYMIRPPLNTTFLVEFEACDCDIEYQSQCLFDSISFGGNNKSCGGLPERVYYAWSVDGEVEVRFSTDGSVTRKGCQIAYSVRVGGQNISRQDCPPAPSTTTSNYTTPSWSWTPSSGNWTTPFWNMTTPSWNWTTPSQNGSIYDLINDIYAKQSALESAYYRLMNSVDALIRRVY